MNGLVCYFQGVAFRAEAGGPSRSAAPAWVWLWLWVWFGLIGRSELGRASEFQQLELAFAPSAGAVAELPGGLPRGEQTFGGIPFRLDGRWAVTGLDDARSGLFHPSRLGPLKVEARADRLHLALGALHEEKVGAPMANLVLHYASGAERALRLVYGFHVLSWAKERSVRSEVRSEALVDPESRLAWSAPGEPDRPGGSTRLFQTVLDNPLPGEEIASLEWVSLFSRATPLLLGVTLERGSGPGLRRPEPEPRRVRKALELPDISYRDHLMIRVRDQDTGAPLTNASAALTISDDTESFYFGRAEADGTGTIRLAFPPQQTVGYAVLVRAAEHVPAMVSSSWTNGTGMGLVRAQEARLARGRRVGGLTQRADGAPIGGAVVTVHQVVSTGAGLYERIDYDVVVSGTDGRWSSESVPAAFTNFSFGVTHPDYRGALYVQGDRGGAGAGAGGGGAGRERMLATEDLIGGRAVITLLPPIRVSGTVLDERGTAVAGAEVTLTEPGRAAAGGGGGLSVKSDAEGKFSLVAVQEGERALVVRAAGYALNTQPLQVEGETAPVAVRLTKARPFRGRVIDQDGNPVAGARVRYDPQGNGRGVLWQAMTDAEGRFVWDSPPGRELMFYVTATNYSSSRMGFGGFVDEQIFRLRRQSRVFGRVVDAETGKPLEEFQVIRGHRYNEGEPMRWSRYDTVRGRRGEFSMRLEEYSDGWSQVLVEAPGYVPQASPEFEKAGLYTNHFALRKGRGIAGVVLRADGTPAPGVSLALVDAGESVEMDKLGELRRSSSGPAFQRSNASGRFEFPAKFDPNTILAASEEGFAQVAASNVVATGRITLAPWGRVEGVLKLRGADRGQGVVLRSSYARYAEPGRIYSALDLSLSAEPDAQGAFVFEKVPPGERQVGLLYRIGDREAGRTGYSHNVPVTVRPRTTEKVGIGGTGRRVIGRVAPQGADPEELDWHRDINEISTSLSLPPQVATLNMRGDMTEAERRAAMREYNQKQAAFWRTEEGRRLERSRRNYVLRFETNGTFRIEDVEPGNYSMYLRLTNPERPLNFYETIASESFNFTIPPAPADHPDAPHDVGELKLTVRNLSRTGRKAPRLEARTFEGKPIRLEDFQGKHVLLDFWATSVGNPAADLKVLKEIQDTFGKDGRCVIIGLNLDPDPSVAQRWVTQNDVKWTQCHLGAWGSSDVPGRFGVQNLPEAVLVDPEGKVVARGMRGAGIRAAVRSRLGRPSVTR